MSEILALRFPKALVVGILAVLAGCASPPNHAPVTDRSSGYIAPPPPPVVTAPPPSGPGYYTVKKGDTLYGIALQAGQDYRQIAVWNNLDSTYIIHVDQVLRVAPPDTGAAQAQPIAGAAVAERPLGAPVAGPPPGYGAPAPTGDVPTLAGPPGTKRPYSDATLAELAKPDADQGVAPAPPLPSTNSAVVVSAQPPAVDEDENVGWAWPVGGPVIAGFNEATNKGLNISGKTGTPILAAGNGTVLYVGNGVRGYGNLVVVKHNATYISVYAHNSKILVAEQQAITKGQKIAEMGDSDADQVELHFEIRRQGKPVDPMKYLQPR